MNEYPDSLDSGENPIKSGSSFSHLMNGVKCIGIAAEINPNMTRCLIVAVAKCLPNPDEGSATLIQSEL